MHAVNESMRAYRMDAAIRPADYLRLADQLGPILDTKDLDEIGKLMGCRPENFAEVNAKLEAFVTSAGPELDEELVRYFYRRIVREEAIFQPATDGVKNATLSPICENVRVSIIR